VLKSLIISSDMNVVWTVEPVLRQLEFDVELKPTVAEGSECLRYARFTAVLVDCARVHSSELAHLRESQINRDIPIIAIAERPGRKVEMLCEAGADAVWTRPLYSDQVHRQIMGIRASVLGDRRLQRRQPLHHPCVLRYSYDGRQFFQSAIVNITETGVAIEGLEELVAGRAVQVKFALPAMQSAIEAVADVVWRNDSGRAGLRFLQMPEQQHRQLERWLRCSRLGLSTGYTYSAN
jgi:CheY-like chemotaxis protein